MQRVENTLDDKWYNEKLINLNVCGFVLVVFFFFMKEMYMRRYVLMAIFFNVSLGVSR